VPVEDAAGEQHTALSRGQRLGQGRRGRGVPGQLLRVDPRLLPRRCGHRDADGRHALPAGPPDQPGAGRGDQERERAGERTRHERIDTRPRWSSSGRCGQRRRPIQRGSGGRVHGDPLAGVQRVGLGGELTRPGLPDRARVRGPDRSGHAPASVQRGRGGHVHLGLLDRDLPAGAHRIPGEFACGRHPVQRVGEDVAMLPCHRARRVSYADPGRPGCGDCDVVRRVGGVHLQRRGGPQTRDGAEEPMPIVRAEVVVDHLHDLGAAVLADPRPDPQPRHPLMPRLPGQDGRRAGEDDRDEQEQSDVDPPTSTSTSRSAGR
jgi:hypothetical protein